MVADPAAAALSIRVLGLEVARIEGLLAPRITFGLPGNARRLEEGNHAEFRQFLETALRSSLRRKPGSLRRPLPAPVRALAGKYGGARCHQA